MPYNSPDEISPILLFRYRMSIDSAVGAIAAAARARQWRVAAAESCTGGLVSAALSEIVGASEWYIGGVVAYHNTVKQELLHVPESVLATAGAVSEETARAMCDGLFRRGATAAVAVTGIAGPSGGSVEKPVGTVCFGFRIGDTAAAAMTRHFPGDRAAVRHAATAFALQQLAQRLQETAA